jgi:hypothetical protein
MAVRIFVWYFVFQYIEDKKEAYREYASFKKTGSLLMKVRRL